MEAAQRRYEKRTRTPKGLVNELASSKNLESVREKWKERDRKKSERIPNSGTTKSLQTGDLVSDTKSVWTQEDRAPEKETLKQTLNTDVASVQANNPVDQVDANGKEKDISILIPVTAESPVLIRNCLASLLAVLPNQWQPYSWEIIVVQVKRGDNDIYSARDVIQSAIDEASTLKSSGIRLLGEFATNTTQAYNLAAESSYGKYLLFFGEAMEIPQSHLFTYPDPFSTSQDVLHYLLNVFQRNEKEVAAHVGTSSMTRVRRIGAIGSKVIYGGQELVYHSGLLSLLPPVLTTIHSQQ